jgi:hypothetical protein
MPDRPFRCMAMKQHHGTRSSSNEPAESSHRTRKVSRLSVRAFADRLRESHDLHTVSRGRRQFLHLREPAAAPSLTSIVFVRIVAPLPKPNQKPNSRPMTHSNLVTFEIICRSGLHLGIRLHKSVQPSFRSTPNTWPAIMRSASRFAAICTIVWNSISSSVLYAQVSNSPSIDFFRPPIFSYPSGRIDYQSIYNQATLGDIQPHDNAALELLTAFGSMRSHSFDNQAFFLALNWDDVGPPDQPRMIRFEEFINSRYSDPKQRESLAELQHDALSRLWKRSDEFPLVSEWISANRVPLQHIVAASERPFFWYPLLSSKPTTILNSSETFLQWTRVAYRLLAARAMQRAANDDVDGSVSDLLALIRLGRLFRSCAGTHCILFGAIYELAGYYGFESLVEGDLLSDAQASACLDIIIAERIPNSLEQEKNLFNRLLSIDALQSLVFDDVVPINIELTQFSHQAELQAYIRERVSLTAAQNEIHQWMDQLVRILRSSDIARREQQFTDLTDRVLKMTKTAAIDFRESPDPHVLGKALGVLVLFETLQKDLSDLDRVIRTENAIIQTSLAIIVAATDGRVISKTQDLVPDYLPTPPIDLDSGLPLAMENSGGTVRIWSSGLRVDRTTPMRLQFQVKGNADSNSPVNAGGNSTLQSSSRRKTNSNSDSGQVIWIASGLAVGVLAIGFILLRRRRLN